jgi:hypothetical protein
MISRNHIANDALRLNPLAVALDEPAHLAGASWLAGLWADAVAGKSSTWFGDESAHTSSDAGVVL